MKTNIHDREEKETAGRNARLNSKNHISADQPFDYEEVVETTGSEYARRLYSDGVMLIPYEELRRNSAVFDFSEEDRFQTTSRVFELCCEYA